MLHIRLYEAYLFSFHLNYSTDIGLSGCPYIAGLLPSLTALQKDSLDMAVESEKMDEKAEDTSLHGTSPEDEDTTASIATSKHDVEDRSIDAIPEQFLTSNGIPVDEEAAATAPAERSRSQASSARSRPMSIVPRLKRRGLFAQLTLVPEVERPYEYPNKIKWTITAFVALAACAAPMGSAIFYRKQTYIFH